MKTWYVAYHTRNGHRWRILLTMDDMDDCDGLQAVIAMIEKRDGTKVVPVFWRRLSSRSDETTEG